MVIFLLQLGLNHDNQKRPQCGLCSVRHRSSPGHLLGKRDQGVISHSEAIIKEIASIGGQQIKRGAPKAEGSPD